VRSGQESVSVGCDQSRRNEADHLLMVADGMGRASRAALTRR
jgi:hypothetical protein